MQYQPAILKVFEANGYNPETIITRKEFEIVMNLLTTDSLPDNRAAQSLVRQIWKEAETNKLKKVELEEDPVHVLQITTSELIEFIVDAIEILTNRISQCRSKKISKIETITELKSRQKEFEQKKDYPKLQVLQHKLTTLHKDSLQFENDLRVLTQPFLNESHRLNLAEQKNPRKASILSSVESIRKESVDKEKQATKKKQQQFNKIPYPELKLYMKEHDGQPLEAETVEDERKAAIWLWGLLILLEATVMVVKYSFLNLMVQLLGMFVLLEPYRRSLTRISYLACLITIPLDLLWLLLYSEYYLSPESNTGLTHIIKPYFQYIWFVTVVELFVKGVLIFILKRYQYHELVLSQQLQQDEEREIEGKEEEIVNKKNINDHYLPNLKQFVKIQTVHQTI